jgi:two-component system, LytTR family, sensor kinase
LGGRYFTCSLKLTAGVPRSGFYWSADSSAHIRHSSGNFISVDTEQSIFAKYLPAEPSLHFMKTGPIYRNKHFVIPVATACVSLILGYILAYINSGMAMPLTLIPEFVRQGWIIILQILGFFYLVYYAVRYFNRKYEAAPNNVNRFFREILVIVIAGFLVEEVFRLLFVRFNVVPEDPLTLNPKLRQLQMLSMTFLLVIYGIVTSVRIFFNLQQRQLEIIKWQKEYAQSQFEGLKNQLNPHFLFNSLSILTSLVYVDADKAEAFIEKLSKTYRYLLEVKEKDRVELRQELEFLRGYTFLVSERFGKKLDIVNNVNSDAWTFLIPPHSLMIALEYIIANNAMSSTKPLQITIGVQRSHVVIAFNPLPKAQIESTSAQQFEALKERYQNLHGVAVEELSLDGTNLIKYPLLTAGDK